jgi:hypothetical protein
MRITALCLALCLVTACSPPAEVPDADAGVEAGADAADVVPAADALEAGAGDAVEASTPDAGEDAAGDAADAGADAADATPDAPCPDLDGDGHASSACGGDDCDDANSARAPGNSEQCDGVDTNCDGHADDAADPEIVALDFYCNATRPMGGPYAPPPGGWDRGSPACWSAGRSLPPGSAYVSVPTPQCQAAHTVGGTPVTFRRVCWRASGAYAECPAF